jgi:hypothetical protein
MTPSILPACCLEGSLCSPFSIDRDKSVRKTRDEDPSRRRNGKRNDGDFMHGKPRRNPRRGMV